MQSKLLGPAFVFPFGPGSRYQPYHDDYGAARGWNPDGADTGRRHEGINILAETWTPLVAVANNPYPLLRQWEGRRVDRNEPRSSKCLPVSHVVSEEREEAQQDAGNGHRT